MSARIRGLDGIRAYAAIIVVTTHLQIFISLYHSNSPIYGIVAGGSNGVKIFFVLSGFLITHLLLSEYEMHGKIRLGYFLARRALRIFPLFYLFIFCLILIGFFFETNTKFNQIIYSSLYLFNFVSHADYNIILGHTWSLAVEEHFYLLWPPFFLFLLKKQISLKKILFILFIIYFILEILHYYLVNSTDLDHTYRVSSWTNSAAVYLLAGCFGGILIHTNYWKNDYYSRANNITLCFIFIFGFFIDFWYDSTTMIGRNIHIWGILSGILIVVNNQNWFIVRILELPPIQYLGQISYGVYLWQGFYLATGPSRGYNQTWPPDPLVGLILLCITVPLSYHLFEMRFLKLKEKFRPFAEDK